MDLVQGPIDVMRRCWEAKQSPHVHDAPVLARETGNTLRRGLRGFLTDVNGTSV